MLSYKALYRKYRPENLLEVVGQEHVITTLKNIIVNNQTSHAYLFSGPRGTGKTSVALAFAKTLNCTNLKENNVPCKTCKQCKSVKNSLDIIEIDAASNNGVNEIRSLIDNVKYAPSISKYKVYIIDEVHMLSKGAFNALLKTLEEPPKYVIFILATTEAHKIPSTILSRTQRFNFHKIDSTIIKEHLEQIMQKEKFDFDDQAVDLITKLANGSIRDSLSILDQVAAYSNGKIYFEFISQVFGITSLENQINLLNLLFKSQIKESLEKVNQWIGNGIDINRLVSSIIEILKDYIIFVQTSQLSLLETLNKENVNLLQINKKFAYESLDIFVELLSSLKISSLPKQIFEIAILKILDLNKDQRKSLIKEVNNFEEKQEVKKEIQEKANQKDQLFTKSFESITNSEEATLQNQDQKDKDDDKGFQVKNEDVEKSETFKENEKSLDKTNEEIFKQFDTSEKTESEEVNDNHDLQALFDTANVSLVNLKEENQKEESNLDNNSFEEESEKISVESLNQKNKGEEEVKSFTEQDISFTKEKKQNLNTEQEEHFKKDKEDDVDILDIFKVDGDTATLNLEPKIEEDKNTKKPLTLNEVINVLVQSSKEHLNFVKDKLSLLDNYAHNIEYGNFVTLLKQTKAIAAGDGFVLISSEKDSVIHAIEDFVDKENFTKFTDVLFGYPQKFFPITKNVFLSSKEKWINLKKEDNLPKSEKIEKLKPLPKEENEVEEFATSIFGELFEK